MNNIEDKEFTFSSLVFSIIMSANLDEVEVYKEANIDRRLFSKIRSNDFYQPSKETAIKIIFALKPGYELAKKLLACAGYHLTNNSTSDIIVNYFLKNNIYDRALLDKILAHNGLKTFFSDE